MSLEKKYCEVAGTVVEVADGFCEVGDECDEACQFVWNGKDMVMSNRAARAFQEAVRRGDYHPDKVTG